MTATPTLHVWHDYVCPFSYVAASRIMRLKETEDLNLGVRFHPWPLETANGAQPAANDEDQWVLLLRTVEPAAFSGWNPSSGSWPPSSALLFAAYEAALAQDIVAAERFDLLVRQAIFQHPRLVNSIVALSELAAEVGLDNHAFETALDGGSAERRARESGAEAQNLGIHGIPTLVLPDGETVLNPGLKIHRTDQGRAIRDEIETLRKVLRRAAGGAPAETRHG